MNSLLTLLSSQSYFILYILMIVEGPIVTLVASAIAAQGLFNPIIILIIAVLGDLTADIALFIIGRLGKTKYLKKQTKKHHIGKKQLQNLKSSLENHPFKAMMSIKIIPPLATPGLILAGSTQLTFPKFLTYSTIISLFNKSIYVIIGYFAGLTTIYTLQKTNAIIGIPIAIALVVLLLFILYELNKYLRNKIKSKEKL